MVPEGVLSELGHCGRNDLASLSAAVATTTMWSSEDLALAVSPLGVLVAFSVQRHVASGPIEHADAIEVVRATPPRTHTTRVAQFIADPTTAIATGVGRPPLRGPPTVLERKAVDCPPGGRSESGSPV